MQNPGQNWNTTFFAPHLALINVKAGMEFYVKAFGAQELRRFSNDDGSVHVAEMEINGATAAYLKSSSKCWDLNAG